jgi:subtilisin family serine protease
MAFVAEEGLLAGETAVRLRSGRRILSEQLGDKTVGLFAQVDGWRLHVDGRTRIPDCIVAGSRGRYPCGDAQTAQPFLSTIALLMDSSLFDPALSELYESGSAEDEVGVIIRMDKGLDPPAIVRVVSAFDDIFTARVRRGDIVILRQSPGVVSVKATTAVLVPKFLEAEEEDEADAGTLEEDVEGDPEGDPEWNVEEEPAELEDAERQADEPPVQPIVEEATLPSLPEDGTGVVVGICDWGFDFTHPNFRNADGTTRMLCLWDQRGFGDPTAPAPYNYGRLLAREAINAALATSDPCATLGYHPADGDPTDTGAHGTHVGDILAGNRREPGSEVGLASGADIVFVHLAAPRLGELGNLGDSVGLLEGLDFCRRQAAGRPCVLHLSAGKTGGEKRGQSPLERAVDTMLKEPGIVLVQSVGNYASSAMHTQARVGPDQRYVLNWVIPAGDRTANELEIWYSGEDVFNLALIAPGGREWSLKIDHRVRLENEGVHWGNFYHRTREPNSGLNHIAIYLYPAAPSGMWRVALHGLDIVDGRLHAWIERDASRRYQSHFLRSQASPRFTTNTICNCFRAIAVGAHDATQRQRPATPFSSRGPTADGRQKPEISAPGYRIRAARSMPRNGWSGNESRLCVKSGTSMAAPWVSGTVALMMQAAGRPLNVHEIRRALVGTADPHPGPSGRSSTKLGYGYLNTAAAVAAARQFARPHQAGSGGPVLSTQTEEAGWGSVWAEDTAAMTELDPTPDIERESDEDARIATTVETDESCGCAGGRDSSAPASPEQFEVEDEGEDESEWLETSEPADVIEAPFQWEDVRDALEFFEEHEEPA